MNMFATAQNQPRLSSITDVAPGGSGKNFMYILTRLTRRMSLVEQEFIIFPVGNI
jgi:hypothetical protein